MEEILQRFEQTSQSPDILETNQIQAELAWINNLDSSMQEYWQDRKEALQEELNKRRELEDRAKEENAVNNE